MRRPVMIAMCSVTGVVTGVSFATSQHTGPTVAGGSKAGVVTATSLTPATVAPPPATTTAPGPTPTATTVPRATKPAPTPAPVVTTAAPKPTTAPAVTVNGAAYNTRYGPVQVQITIRSGRITGADAIEYPTGDRRDQEINSYAVPELNQETVDAQSAQIDTVSGATYTSDGYRQSLQSAIDAANKAGAL
jgi:uncharacterized protein with FMN-binding domain